MATTIINNGRINYNGKPIKVNGTLSLIDGKWYVDGKEVDMNELANVQEDDKIVNITINLAPDCVIEHLDVDSCKTITINGNCKRVKTNMGDIRISGDVDGDVHTNMGSIECGSVHGDAHTNMGSVHYRK